MRISFILSSLWLSGGVRVIVEYANRLTARGHQITLVAPGNTIEPDIAGELDPSVTLRKTSTRRPSNNNIFSMLQLTWALARATPPSDLVISTHTPTTGAGFIASHILKRGRPVWLYQDYREMFIDRPLIDWLLRHALHWHDCAWVVSQYSQQELLAFVPGEITIIGEGLSHAPYFHPLTRNEGQYQSEHPKSILFLGDMRPRKGLPDFLQAASVLYESLPDIILWIVSKDEIQIQSDVPHRIIYRPSRSELATLYATCDVFVSASWWESFGLPPLEAMACGAPVVLTDSRGIREYAIPGKNCVLTPPSNPKMLAGSILEVLTSPELSNHLRKNGPSTAAEFNWDSAVNRFESASQKIMNQHLLKKKTG